MTKAMTQTLIVNQMRAEHCYAYLIADADAREAALVDPTGLLGVGGGFIIVPALALVLGLPMARAVGTSLGVIAINCAAGLTTAAVALDADRMLVTTVFATLAVTGTLIGARTASRARPDVLRRVFGLVVLGVGVYTGADTFF